MSCYPKKPPTTRPCRDSAAPSPTAAARSNCSPPAATAAREAIMLAHGFSIELMVELVRAGLATARAERMVAGGRAMEVVRVRITEKGPRGPGGNDSPAASLRSAMLP